MEKGFTFYNMPLVKELFLPNTDLTQPNTATKSNSAVSYSVFVCDSSFKLELHRLYSLAMPQKIQPHSKYSSEGVLSPNDTIPHKGRRLPRYRN